MTAYYNEMDAYAAQWLRNLIDAGHIASGIVDERSIEDVKPNDLHGFTQCHFFAGIGVWSLALRRAGWPDDRPVWTGSCPCQPFSAAGKGAGVTDERHLWPHFYHLITQQRPVRVFGEQVASKDGLAWLDLVQADLEGAGYASGAVDLCAAGVGAPHIRQRLWFTAERLDDANDAGLEGGCLGRSAEEGRETADGHAGHPSGSGGVADTDRVEWGAIEEPTKSEGGKCGKPNGDGSRTSGLADSEGVAGVRSSDRQPGPTNGLWRATDWLACRDGKWRPVRPGSFPLAHGAPSRVGRLRAFGNAVNVEVATEFIKAAL